MKSSQDTSAVLRRRRRHFGPFGRKICLHSPLCHLSVAIGQKEKDRALSELVVFLMLSSSSTGK